VRGIYQIPDSPVKNGKGFAVMGENNRKNVSPCAVAGTV
jgi:hypothetical protein